MVDYIEDELNMTLTENGATTYASTGSDCLDLFSAIGALRSASDEEINKRFVRAYSEDKDIAMKLLFYARDIRGGLGERRVFRTILKKLATTQCESVKKNMGLIAEFGRYDDLLVLMDTPCEDAMLELLKAQFDEDMRLLSEEGAVSLLGKWLPSVNASSASTRMAAMKVCKAFGLTAASYRKSLSVLRAKIKIIENNLRERDYTFDYEKQPSRAMYKYRAAFFRNDPIRYSQYLNDVTSGHKTMHTDNLMTYELVEHFVDEDGRMSEGEVTSLNAMWQSLPDYGSDENAIAVIDTSGSMYGGGVPVPGSVALSLGLYFAEHNKGAFAGSFIAFSRRPKLIKIKGETFADKVRYLMTFNEVADTNLEAVFEVILKTAVKNHVPQSELPKKLIIISDMEFNSCVDNASFTNFENAKNRYAEYGYQLPNIIFWNVQSRRDNQPVKKNEQGVALVSGLTPKLFDMVCGGVLDPYTFMMDVLGGERYKGISA
jgi:hypothetical protein